VTWIQVDMDGDILARVIELPGSSNWSADWLYR